MKPRHQVSRAGLELTKRFEGYRRKAAQLPDGRWTLGHGHTLTARQGAEVSEADAEALLIYDLMQVAEKVAELVFTPLTDNQFDALCAFAFNVGLDAFRASDVLKRVNEGALIEAAYALELWRRADFEGERIVIDGLVRRRAAEKALFLTPPGEAWPPVPSALLKPVLDDRAPVTPPSTPPVPVVAPMDGDDAVVERETEPTPPEPFPPAPDEPPPFVAEATDDPVASAAEAVTARLSTIFRDQPPLPAPSDEAALEAPRPEPEQAELPVDEPFTLTSPVVEPETSEPAPLEPEAGPDDAPTAELFPEPEAANDAEAVAAALLEPEAAAEEAARDRVVIDDTAPFEFIPPRVQPLPQRAAEGYLALVVMAILGLAFFAGGLFWAANAQPALQPGLLTPKVVGALAGVAGVGLFSIAVYLFLQRLGRDDEPR